MNNFTTEELDKFVKDIKSDKIKNYIIIGKSDEGTTAGANGQIETLAGLLHIMQITLDKDIYSSISNHDMIEVMSKILGE